MSAIYDLHTHSTASDGAYAPAELVRQAASAGVTHLALTDHDSTDGLTEAQAAARDCGNIRLIPGVEISVSWQDKSVHIVGLNIDRGCQSLQEGLASLQATRLTRAEEIGRRLAKHGVEGAFEAARAMAGTGMITRTHFARYLVQSGLAPGIKEVFDRYLTHGKPGYVSTRWANLADAVGWIAHAGGVAVLAHPQRYKLTGSWMRRLLAEFKESGGVALEVISGTGNPNEIQTAVENARRFDLLASVGSDFHSPEHNWLKLGRLPPLPLGATPVWRLWDV
jgi:predicted metal-dependent phosphoesterase TrpH